MGRHKSPVRLRLKPSGAPDERGRRTRYWYIVDDGKGISTGFREDRRGEAEEALTDYLAFKRAQALPKDPDQATSPAEVLIDDVIGLYALERVNELADPIAVKARLDVLLDYFTGKTLAFLTRTTCKAYVQHRKRQPIRAFKDKSKAKRVTAQTARRELEELSAAIGWWHGDRPLTRVPKLWYPKKPKSPRSALSRSQCAALLLAAMGWRIVDGRWTRAQSSTVTNRAHLRRFILIGLYTGTRPGVIPRLRWHESVDHPWIDLDKGWIYRRGAGEEEHANKLRPICRIPKRLRAHLRRWKADDEARNIERRRLELKPLETVIHHGGEPITSLRTTYAHAVEDAGLPSSVTPHWHRHTAATWMMEFGEDPYAASQYLGMSLATLEEHYLHHHPDLGNNAGEAAAASPRRRREAPNRTFRPRGGTADGAKRKRRV